MTRAGLALRYAAFAAVATFANLGTQRLALAGQDGPRALAMALLLGTAVGLVVKYTLDKRWIFGDRDGGLAAHGRKFSLYTLMGGATTALFWATETLFWLTWGTATMREVGAVLGLALGYAVKYRLDRRWVFSTGAGMRPA